MSSDLPLDGDRSLCFKCGGTGLAHLKTRRSPIDRKSTGDTSKFQHSEKQCQPCKGKGAILAKKKLENSEQEGVVTKSKRPEGWVPPGPPPKNLDKIMPDKGEALCYLCGDWRIFQPIGGHRYSTDDVVTAWVAGREARRLLGHTENLAGLDLGCGLASVLMMMCWQFESATYTGIEAQAKSVERAKRSLYVNGCDDRVTIYHGDLRDITTILSEEQSFDIITGTPPYFDVYGISEDQLPKIDPKSGIRTKKKKLPTPVPAAVDQRPCNFEYRGGVEVYCRAARRHLKNRGLFFICFTDLPTSEERMQKAAAESGEGSQGLKILKKLEVIPKEGIRPLFSVYIMCRYEDQGYFHEKMGRIQEMDRTCRISVGESGQTSPWGSSSSSSSNNNNSSSSSSSSKGSALIGESEGGVACKDSDSKSFVRDYSVEQIVVRTAQGERTEEYSQLLRDLGGYG